MAPPILQPRVAHLASHDLVSSGATDQDFLAYARAVATRTRSVVLLSGGEHDAAQHSILAWDPFVVLQAKGRGVRLQVGDVTQGIEGHPLDVMDEVAAHLRPDFDLPVHPFSGGAVGYAAYDLKNVIERLPQTVEDDLGLPDLLLLWPRRVLVHNRRQQRIESLAIHYDGDDAPAAAPPEPRQAVARGFKLGRLQSDFTHDAYLAAVRRIREYIRNGDVYQVNMSQRFAVPLDGDPFEMWVSLYELNPAPFYAFVQGGDHQVVCTSMERFLLRRGPTIETRPIKGTRPRGATPEEDETWRAELANSPKDDAELSMIVDLLRNDLGRVCKGRTVNVAEHRRLEAYQNVYHLVSIVKGELRDGVTPGDILRATFPGGSITGCPKIRSMEIIDELERHVRHVYTGSIGYLGWHDNMDLNIAIRTAIVRGGKCHLSVGGGCVYDSDPQAEYEETLHKGRTFFEVIERLRGT